MTTRTPGKIRHFYRDKVIWLTGASSGIGEALARDLAGRGARLVLSARRVEELARVRSGCAEPDRHHVVPLDLSRSDGFADLVAATEAKVGSIDMLINNAGISQRSLARDTLIAVDRQLMEVDYFGTIALTKAVLPAMLRRRSGHIVTVTSVAGKLGTPMRSGYCAAKHALHGFFDSLRAELWRERIRVSLVCPGFVRTGLPLVALTGDGRPQGRMDPAAERGIAPELVARRMLDRLAAGQDEIVIAGGKERLALWLKRLAPAVLDHVMRTARVT